MQSCEAPRRGAAEAATRLGVQSGMRARSHWCHPARGPPLRCRCTVAGWRRSVERYLAYGATAVRCRCNEDAAPVALPTRCTILHRGGGRTARASVGSCFPVVAVVEGCALLDSTMGMRRVRLSPSKASHSSRGQRRGVAVLPQCTPWFAEHNLDHLIRVIPSPPRTTLCQCDPPVVIPAVPAAVSRALLEARVTPA